MAGLLNSNANSFPVKFHETFMIGSNDGGGVIFVPTISKDGILSWVNNGGLENPEPINIKGDPFTYSDFTPEQLALLKGEKGNSFTYEDFTPEQLAALKGEPGKGLTDEQLAEVAANTEARHEHLNKSLIDGFYIDKDYGLIRHNEFLVGSEVVYVRATQSGDTDGGLAGTNILIEYADGSIIDTRIPHLPEATSADAGKLISVSKFGGYKLIEAPMGGLTDEQLAEVTANTEARHEHENKGVLDGFSVNEDEQVLYNGELLGGKDEVYIGNGEMPDGYCLQIDPEGEVAVIPTKISELENDSGFITADDLPEVPEVSNITPEQTTFFEFEPSSNLLDVSTMKVGLLDTTDKIYTADISPSYGAYRYFEQYIPVNEGDVLTVQYTYNGNRYSLVSANTGFSRVIAYDENKNVLTSLGVKTTSTYKATTYTVPATVSYVRISLSSNFDNWTDVALVKNTAGIIPYEVYGASGKSYIKPEYIREDKKEQEEVLAFLPDEIVCAVGRTIEIYNNQVCPLAEKYHIRWYSTVGKALERKYSITGEEDYIGDYKLTFEIYDDDENVVFAKDTTIKIVADAIPESFVVCPIGDSLTNGKPWLTEVPTLSNNKVSYVGTRGNGKHEGRSGFTSTGYTTAHGYDFEKNNIEEVHPFWDGSKFSWSYYKTNSGISADAVQIFLGTNDLFGNTSGEKLAENIKLMVDDIRSTEADMPIFVVLTILVGSQNGLGNQRASDGFTAMYKGKNKYLLDCKFVRAMNVLHDTFKDYDNLYFIPLTECHDNEYNFGEVETPVNPRATQTEIMPKEAIHPQQQGYEQMADVMYSVYCRAFTS